MMLEIQALPAFTDNYIWLVKNNNTKQALVVDPGEASPVLVWLQQNKDWQLTNILITHHHQDHTGGIVKLVEETKASVFAPNNPSIPHNDNIVTDNQAIDIIGITFHVLAVPGHTLDHVVYYIPKSADTGACLFSGDTLFSGGCGRVFEGTMAQMYDSLQRINKLPLETLIYPAHEYTISNLKFAQIVESDNKKTKEYLDKCLKLRAVDQITLPSSLRLEQQVNPFLRCNQNTIISTIKGVLKLSPISPDEVFSILREWKNRF